MRRIFTPLIIIVFACTTAAAQKKTVDGKWTGTLTPALIPLPTGGQFGIQPGAEFLIKPRLGLLLEFTFQTGKRQHADSLALNKRYFRLKPEVRYYLNDRNNRISNYIGLQGSYTFRSFVNRREGFYYDNFRKDSVFAFDEAHIYSPITTFSLQYGIMLSDGRRMSADIFAGMGLRFVNTTFTEVKNLRLEQSNLDPNGYSSAASYQKKGWLSEMMFNAGVRFMYRFGKLR